MKKLLFIILAVFIGVSINAQTCTPDGTVVNDTVIASPLPFQVDFPERGFHV